MPIAAAYWPDWSANSNPPEGVDYGRFDVLFYAFATPNSSSTLNFDDGGEALLRRLVAAARNSGKGTKIVLSVGGWGGSYWFSQAVQDPPHRQTFMTALVNTVNNYGLDGIDIDWEYPNSEGNGNPHSPQDSANFLILLQKLRRALGPSKIISTAVAHLPWLGPDRQPLTNVSEYAKVLSYVNVMNYDVFGASSNPGPNAPLGNLCGNSWQPQSSAQAALKQWNAAGFPASQILLGLPLYGYVSRSTATSLSGSGKGGTKLKADLASNVRDKQKVQLTEHNKQELQSTEQYRYPPANRRPDIDGNAGSFGGKVQLKAAVAGDLSSLWGQQVAFNRIVSSGALRKKLDGTYGEANGYTMAWDDCSDTPFLYNVGRSTLVTYDDTYSMDSKASFAKQSQMAGCFTWSLDQDDGYSLQDVVRRSLGK